MPICAVQLPIVRIFKDFDKMSANEQYAAINGDGGDDEKITIKFTTINMDDKDCCTSSNDDDEFERRRPNRHRKLSNDGVSRKRSTTHNLTYKTSKAFTEAHGSGSSSSQRRLNPASPPGGGLRKQLLVRRSPSPSFMHRNRSTSPNGMPMLSPGYMQYQMSFLEVPLPRDYGDASSDDLSSEWDSDVQEPQRPPKVNIFST